MASPIHYININTHSSNICWASPILFLTCEENNFCCNFGKLLFCLFCRVVQNWGLRTQILVQNSAFTTAQLEQLGFSSFVETGSSTSYMRRVAWNSLSPFWYIKPWKRNLFLTCKLGNLYLSVYFVHAGETTLDDVIRLKNSSTDFTPQRDKTGTGQVEVEQDEGIETSAMGVGKNTTSKVLESGNEAGKYEDDCRHGACFYPIPVNNFFW